MHADAVVLGELGEIEIHGEMQPIGKIGINV